jgi:uncharacterized protein
VVRKILGLLCFICLLLSINITIAFGYSSNNVIDYLDLLSENDVTSLQQSIDEIKLLLQYDAVIVITSDLKGKNITNFSDDFYDYNNYGVGSDKSGLLLSIDMSGRDIWISTTGKAIGIFNQSIISNMVDKITTELKDTNYNGACQVFLSDVIKYTSTDASFDGSIEINGEIYETSKNDRFLSKVVGNLTSFVPYIIAFAVALIASLIMYFKHNHVKKVATTAYESQDSFNVNISVDDYIRTSTHKVRIKSNSGSSHRGSSGRSHGGGGGSF